MGASNVCKFGDTKETLWRCAHIEWRDPASVPDIYSSGYEWACCLPTGKECKDVSYSILRNPDREATISLDVWKVYKGPGKTWNCASRKLCRWNERRDKEYPLNWACDSLQGPGRERKTMRLISGVTEETASSAAGRSRARPLKVLRGIGGVRGAPPPPGTGGASGGAYGAGKRKKPRAPPKKGGSSGIEKAGLEEKAKKEYDDIYDDDDDMYHDMDDDDYYDQDAIDYDLAAQQNVLMDQYEYDVAVEAAKERRAVEKLRNEKRRIDRLKKKMHRN